MKAWIFVAMAAFLAGPAHAFKKAGEATPAPAAPAAVQAPAAPAKPVAASPAPEALKATVAKPAPVLMPVPVKPVAPVPAKPETAKAAKPVAVPKSAAKPAVTVRERTGAGGQKNVSGEIDVGQAVRNMFKSEPSTKSEGKAVLVEKKPGKTVAKAPPENEEGVADKVTQKFGSWFERMKAENAKRQAECEADQSKCAWGDQ